MRVLDGRRGGSSSWTSAIDTQVMGDARLAEQVSRVGAAVHVYGHSHQNVDCVLGGVRYVQNALGHPEDGLPCMVAPVVVFDHPEC